MAGDTQRVVNLMHAFFAFVAPFLDCAVGRQGIVVGKGLERHLLGFDPAAGFDVSVWEEAVGSDIRGLWMNEDGKAGGGERQRKERTDGRNERMEEKGGLLEGLFVVFVEISQAADHDAIMHEIEMVFGECPGLFCVVDFELITTSIWAIVERVVKAADLDIWRDPSPFSSRLLDACGHGENLPVWLDGT